MPGLLDDLNARLSHPYTARAFEDADREPITAAANSQAHPMEAESADEWRQWDAMATDPTKVRITLVANGEPAGTGVIHAGMNPRTDGSVNVHVAVFPARRSRGLGSAMLAAFEAEARRRGAPKLHSQASAGHPLALAWAARRGFREIGRRIMSYRALASYDPDRWHDALDRVAREGIRLRSVAEVLAERDEAGRERFWREMWEAEAPMFEDIPFAAPAPHWAFERFHAMVVESGRLLPELSLVAYDGEVIAGFTTTGARGEGDGWTWMTGVARTHRGRGVAMALKVAALSRAKARGLRAMCTVNDEPNKAMRGVNEKLGYEPVPASVELEKDLPA